MGVLLFALLFLVLIGVQIYLLTKRGQSDIAKGKRAWGHIQYWSGVLLIGLMGLLLYCIIFSVEGYWAYYLALITVIILTAVGLLNLYHVMVNAVRTCKQGDSDFLLHTAATVATIAFLLPITQLLYAIIHDWLPHH